LTPFPKTTTTFPVNIKKSFVGLFAAVGALIGMGGGPVKPAEIGNRPVAIGEGPPRDGKRNRRKARGSGRARVSPWATVSLPPIALGGTDPTRRTKTRAGFPQGLAARNRSVSGCNRMERRP